MGTPSRFDDKSNPIEGLNRVADRDAGNSPESATQIRWTRFTGNDIDPYTGRTLTANNRTSIMRNDTGFHDAVLLSTTGHDALPDTINSVRLTDDAGLFIGAGKQLRLYGPGGTNHSALWGTDTGLANVLGVGPDAGSMAFGPLPAATGKLRIPFGTYVKSRNEANGGDIFLIGTSTGNSVLVGDPTASPILYLQAATTIINKVGAVNVTTLDVTGKLTFLPLGSRIVGDLTHATLANRLAFQSSTVNGTSSLGVLPAGTATQADVAAYNTAAPASASVAAVWRAVPLAAQLRSDSPSGVYQPLEFWVNNLLQLTLGVTGVATFVGGVTLGGHLLWTVDNTFDIGALGASRPRDLYLGRNLLVTGDVTFTGALYTAITSGIALAQSGAVGATLQFARYRIYGKMCHLQLRVTSTGAGTAAAAAEITGIPAAIAPRVTGVFVTNGVWHHNRAAGIWHIGSVVFASATTLRAIVNAGTSYLGADPSFALASGDNISVDVVYELA